MAFLVEAYIPGMEIEEEPKYYLSCSFGIPFSPEDEDALCDYLATVSKYDSLGMTGKMKYREDSIKIITAGPDRMIALSSFTEKASRHFAPTDCSYSFSQLDLEGMQAAAEPAIIFLEGMLAAIKKSNTCRATEHLGLGWAVYMSHD